MTNFFTVLNGYPAADLWTRLDSDHSKGAHNIIHIHWNVECIRQNSLTLRDATQACKCMSPFQSNQLPPASKQKTV